MRLQHKTANNQSQLPYHSPHTDSTTWFLPRLSLPASQLNWLEPHHKLKERVHRKLIINLTKIWRLMFKWAAVQPRIYINTYELLQCYTSHTWHHYLSSTEQFNTKLSWHKSTKNSFIYVLHFCWQFYFSAVFTQSNNVPCWFPVSVTNHHAFTINCCRKYIWWWKTLVWSCSLYRLGQKNGLFWELITLQWLTGDMCDMSKVSEFCLVKSIILASQCI